MEASLPASPRISALLHTALHDTGGESIEGAFVDHWVSNVSVAIEEMESFFTQHGFAEADVALFRAALRQPSAPIKAAVHMLSRLRQWMLPLVEELLDDPLPEARALAVSAAAELFEPGRWVHLLDDPHPTVRAAAVSAVARRRRDNSDAQLLLRRALEDEAPQVRLAAARAIHFYREPEGAQALVQRLNVEPDRQVRKAIITAVAEETNRIGIHVDSGRLAEGIGQPILAMLLRGLNHHDDTVRNSVARALQRFATKKVATAMLERLSIEDSPNVLYLLLNYTGYNVIAERALPVFASLRQSNPYAAGDVVRLLRSFGARAIPLLLDALEDPSPHVRREATVSLAVVGEPRALPLLLDELADPANGNYSRELENALRDITIKAAELPPRVPPPDMSARIQQWIDSLNPDPLRQWPQRVTKEDFNALLLHITQIYLWAITPDGIVLCMDHEAFSRPMEPETNSLTLFAVMVPGARRYPELYPLIPPPPAGTRYCIYCRAIGWSYDDPQVTCLHCSGQGWV